MAVKLEPMPLTEAAVITTDLAIEPESPAYWHRKLFWIVLIGIVLRVGFIGFGGMYKVSKMHGTFGYGWEMGRIAQSLIEGHGYANPLQKPTGPTAWEPPGYPFLIAGVFWLFGVYTKTAAFVLLSINSVFS